MSIFDELATEQKPVATPNVVQGPTVKMKSIFDELAEETSAPTSSDLDASGEVVDKTSAGVEFFKQLALTPAASVEAVGAVGGGILSTFNPLPGFVGIVEGLRTGSVDKAASAVQETQAAFAPYLQYQPKTKLGQGAVEKIQKTLDFFISTPTSVLGEAMVSGASELGLGPNVSAALGTLTKVGSELAAYKLLFDGLGEIKQKVVAGEQLTPSEAAKIENHLIKVGKVLEKTRLKAEKHLVKQVKLEGTLNPESLIGGKTVEEIRGLVRSGDASVLGLLEQGIREHGNLAIEDAIKPASILGEVIKQKSELSPEFYSLTKKNIQGLDPQIQEVFHRNAGQGIKAEHVIVPEPTKLPELIGQTGLSDKPVQLSKKPGLQVMDLIKQRSVNVQQALLRTERFAAQELEGRLTETELEAIPFLVQRIKNPEVLNKIGKGELAEFLKNPSKQALETVKKVQDYFDDAFSFLKDQHDNTSYIENYVTQIWDIPKSKQAEAAKSFSRRNPFLQKRTIPSLEEGIALGLKPKVLNIAQLVRIYDNYKIRTVENMKFADQLKNLVDENGERLIRSIHDAPREWAQVNHPALNRAVYSKLEGDAVLLREAPVKVHPEIAQELNLIFGKRMQGPEIGGVDLLRAINVVSAFSKKSELSLSFFHHWALTEASLASGIGKKAFSLWNPYKVYKAVKHGDYEIFKNMPLADDAIAHNVTFGALADVQRGVVKSALEGAERKLSRIKYAGTAFKAFRKANEVWDSALWDYYHNSLKLYGYESLVERALKSARKKKDLTVEEIEGVKSEIGSLVNDAFGGQNWELHKVLGQPKMQQTLQLLLLSPDWSISVLTQALAPARGLYKSIKGTTPTDKFVGNVLMKRGAAFWFRAAATAYVIMQAVNYTTTKNVMGEGKPTWKNDPGHNLDIFIGFNDDGTKKYLRFAKHFREVIDWVEDPLRTLGSKLAPPTREAIRQLSKHDPGSGFPTEFAEEEFWQSLPNRAESASKIFLPFSLRGYLEDKPTQFLFALPVSRGMTNYKTIKLFEEAIEKKDREQLKRVYVAALENHLNSGLLVTLAARNLKTKAAYEDKDVAKEIYVELTQLDEEAKLDAVRHYSERGILTSSVLKQLKKLLESKASIQQQREAVGIKEIKK